MAGIRLQGEYRFRVLGPDGKVWDERICANGVCIPAINNLESVYYQDVQQSPTWCIGLIADAGYIALSVQDTMASHPGWFEATSPGAFPPVPGIPSGKSAAVRSFTLSSINPAPPAGTAQIDFVGNIFNPVQPLVGSDPGPLPPIRGAFLVNTQGLPPSTATSGILWSHCVITGPPISLPYNAILRISYHLRMSPQT